MLITQTLNFPNPSPWEVPAEPEARPQADGGGARRARGTVEGGSSGRSPESQASSVC